MFHCFLNSQFLYFTSWLIRNNKTSAWTVICVVYLWRFFFVKCGLWLIIVILFFLWADTVSRNPGTVPIFLIVDSDKIYIVSFSFYLCPRIPLTLQLAIQNKVICRFLLLALEISRPRSLFICFFICFGRSFSSQTLIQSLCIVYLFSGHWSVNFAVFCRVHKRT